MLFVAACAAMSVKAQGPFDLNLFSKVSYESVSSTIFASAVDNNGVVSVKAGAKIKDAWDNQFWIDAPEIKDVQFPLWAWQYYRGKNRAKPRRAFDMLESYEEEVVYMELLLPASRVLSSDFILWHQVLNNWGIDIDDGMEMKETWQRIFDKDFIHPDWTSKAWEDRIIQSTFWCLKKEDIVYADLLKRQEGRKALLRKRLYPINN